MTGVWISFSLHAVFLEAVVRFFDEYHRDFLFNTILVMGVRTLTLHWSVMIAKEL